MPTHLPAQHEHSLAQPWTAEPTGGELAGDDGRPTLIAPAIVERIVLDATGESLPLLVEFADHRRYAWRKFEVPATATRREQGPAHDAVGMRLLSREGRPRSLRVRLRRGLPHLARPAHPAQSPADRREPDRNGHAPHAHANGHATADRYRSAAQAAEQMTDLHLDLVNRLYDAAEEQPGMFWATHAGGLGAWPLASVLEAWRQVGRQQGPGPALIVALARRLPRLLHDVCHHPRRLLTRERRLQTAGRIQEVDATCIRYLARQPGATAAEKVGARQEALGIVRAQSADTLENRVVRDLIRRAAEECDRYTAEHRLDADHRRVRQVAEFRRLLHRLAADSPVARLPPVTGIPTPNHALQRDPRYRPLWKAFILLIRRDRQRDRAWRWRHRVWAEACTLGVLGALATIQPVAAALRSGVLIRAEQECGRFVDPRTAIGRWDLLEPDNPSTLTFLDGRQLGDYQTPVGLPEGFIRLCPDAAIVQRDLARPDATPRRIIGIWSALDFDLHRDRLADRCGQIAAALRLIPGATEFRAMLIQPRFETDDAGDEQESAVDEAMTDICRGLRITLPVQAHERTLARHLRQMLA